jgi:hypothetical protein
LAVSVKDREILRNLAFHQMELANSQVNKTRIKEWYEHNDYKGKRPMIHFELGSYQNEVLQKRLCCESKDMRAIEADLYRNFVNFEVFNDDKPVRNYFPIQWNTWFLPFDMEVKTTYATSGGVGHLFEDQIVDLSKSLPKLKKSSFGLDRESTLRRVELLNNTFGDILPVRIEGLSVSCYLTYYILKLMGMETMLFSICDYPEEFKEMMSRLTDDFLEYYRFCENEALYLPTTGFEHVGQGSFAFNTTLKQAPPVKLSDIWLHMNSQESVVLSPEMFGAFIFPYYKKIADQFGRLSYGCCEPVDGFWKSSFSKFINLGKITISPWCSQEFMGNELRGKNIIFHRKPSPNYIGVNKELDEEAFRAHINETLFFAQGCHLEITQRDVYTIHNNEAKVRRYVAIIRECIEKYWQS